MSKVLALMVLSLGVATAANAGSSRPHSTYASVNHQSVATGTTDATADATPAAAPEIDPASAISAFTLLAGGLAVVRGRRSAQKGV